MHDFPDRFKDWYDELDDAAVLAEAERWLGDPALDRLSAKAMSLITAGRPSGALAMLMDSGDDRQARRFAVLRGIDQIFAYLNPRVQAGRPPTPELRRLERHYAVHRRFDSGRTGGALLPRLVHPGRPLGDPSHKRDLFVNLLRVPEATWRRCDVSILGEALSVDGPEWRAGIPVACVPVIADPGEMAFAPRVAGGRRYYRIGPSDAAVTHRRIVEIVTNLDNSGAMIAVAPELTLTPELLARWQRVVRARDRRGSRLRWLLIGTGNLSAGGRPSNTAVILDARTGAEIARQEKMFPFNLDAKALRLWGLAGQLGSEPIAEDLRPGRRLTMLEAGPLRIGVLICEDLARAIDIGPLVRDLGLSLLLAPVFSRPLKPHRWEHKAGEVHLLETGTTVVVSNSMVVAGLGVAGDGTALVVPGDGDEPVLLGRAKAPAEPWCFRLLAEGRVETC